MYILEKKIIIKADLDMVWTFFSSPHNLKKITPPSMGFDMLTGGSGSMYAGQIISYKVRPVAGIPITWVTEITHIEPKSYFVDEQRFGPYSMWHHEHRFRKVDGGIEMTDIVSYVLPLGFFGRLAHAFFVKRKLQKIFNYRSQVIDQLFEIVKN